MKVSVFGAGYVGLVTGACLAEMGNDVLCLDIDPRKIAVLQARRDPDPRARAWPELVQRNAAAGRLQFTTDAADRGGARHASRSSRVGTPPDEDGSADLDHVLAAAASDRPPHDRLQGGRRQEHGAGGHGRQGARGHRRGTAPRAAVLPFAVVSNPEFLKEGAAIDDFMRPDRIIVGADDEQAALLMRALYAPFHAQPRAPVGDGRAQRRTHQVRRQRDAGHAHQLHERNGAWPSAWAPTSNRCARASAATRASAPISCTPAAAGAARAFPRT